jgi:hypothetical protein
LFFKQEKEKEKKETLKRKKDNNKDEDIWAWYDALSMVSSCLLVVESLEPTGEHKGCKPNSKSGKGVLQMIKSNH